MKHLRFLHVPCLAAILLLAACTQDELTDNTMLPGGMYPLEIAGVTLSVESSEQSQTRVSENEYGTGSLFTENDAITVSLGGETATYTYDGSKWTSTAPLYWQNTQTATVNAWYPTTATVSLANQSEGLAYVLKGSGTGSYKSGVSLTFTHSLAKVRVVLEGEKAGDVQKVEIFSNTSCTHNQGTVSTEGASQDWITMYQAEYDGTTCWEANVVRTITPDKFIRLNGSSVATVTGITDLAAGSMYTVNLNVEAEDPGYTIDENGTYKVYTAEGLQAWASHVNQGNWDTDCTLTADITLTGTNNWTPVGANHAYSGTFDGAGHTISGMNISYSTYMRGFIANLSGTVKNVTFTEASVSGSSHVGGIVGNADAGSTITGCSASGTVSGTSSVGGIVGNATDCNITGCSASGTVNATSDAAGGIAGYYTESCITACWSTAEATASSNSGCFVGVSERNTYTVCYWGNTTMEDGIGRIMYETVLPIHVEGNVTWSTAMTEMNTALANSGYRWALNTGSDKEDVPLVLVSD